MILYNTGLRNCFMLDHSVPPSELDCWLLKEQKPQNTSLLHAGCTAELQVNMPKIRLLNQTLALIILLLFLFIIHMVIQERDAADANFKQDQNIRTEKQIFNRKKATWVNTKCEF